jgi:undecaprenyl-diphosphatase
MLTSRSTSPPGIHTPVQPAETGPPATPASVKNMHIDLLKILVLAMVQGAAELLPISSSAHVIVAEKLMGIDPTAPAMTLLLVMLHTGTMFAVIVYFRKEWRAAYFSSVQAMLQNGAFLFYATLATGVVGLGLQAAIKHLVSHNAPDFEIENLFGNARLMAGALAAAGILIIASSRCRSNPAGTLNTFRAVVVGAVQGLCLPFRGFSRSGATISTGLVLGVARRRAEEFSFALAVVLTPVVILKELLRLYRHESTGAALSAADYLHQLTPGLVGMLFSFGAGLLALRWLSSWLESGRWYFFGAYCLVASLVVLWIG